MRHDEFLTAIRTQCEALRAAALATGPDANVPTCPKWTVSRLVGHLGRVQSWVVNALADPTGQDVRPERPPSDWADLLDWWDGVRTKMLDGLTDPDAPTWLPFATYPAVAASWARRQAHEAAIHRLDAEHALAASPALVFDAAFAVDGIDELVTWMVPTRREWSSAEFDGTVRVRATDADRSWNVRFSPGAAPSFEPGTPDLTIEGPADAVYRRVWGRPSTAVVTGNVALLEPIASP